MSETTATPPSRKRGALRVWIIAAGAILLVGFIIVGLFLAARPPKEQIQAMVEAETFTVATKAPSRVEQLLVSEGDRVTAGQVLAVMSSPEIEAKDVQARALLQSAEALQSLSREGARHEDIRTVESIWRASQATERLADQTARRAEALFAEGVISAQRRDEAVAARAATAAQTEAARQQYVKAQTGTRPQERSVADAQVSGAQAAVAETTSLQSETRLVAPHAGEVSQRFANVGELVLIGVPVYTVVDTADPWVSFTVREDQYRDLKMGATLHGDIPALGLKNAAFRVTAISPQGEFATWRSTRQSSGYDVRSFAIKAKPVQPIANLRPGMSVLFDWSRR
ncbi:HlyD family secretion protein [Brevundimonas nasdae]|uniref:HlyD family secretion protein n=1 Tax=Brevundimonas nasdae TaxID=172043 RepID=UPI0019144F95|nr:HlyD family secretion protein [Brevundimonas nasdae]MBK6026100.1 efflux RND transporter periplasmic adaptor subunit [Brevundimonas nasdae]MDQ0452749.1 HlyD family secretion protein [Brevundimonas nasdae]